VLQDGEGRAPKQVCGTRVLLEHWAVEQAVYRLHCANDWFWQALVGWRWHATQQCLMASSRLRASEQRSALNTLSHSQLITERSRQARKHSRQSSHNCCCFGGRQTHELAPNTGQRQRQICLLCSVPTSNSCCKVEIDQTALFTPAHRLRDKFRRKHALGTYILRSWVLFPDTHVVL